MGYCAGCAVPGYANAGFGMRHGRGFRRMYDMTAVPGLACNGAHGFSPFGYQNPTPEVDEKTVLLNQADFLEKQLKAIRERLKGFEKDKK
jgi:hypothetical protein